MPELPPRPTKAQLELLRWIVAYEQGDVSGVLVRMTRDERVWRGGDLISFYHEKALARAGIEYAARGEVAPDWAGGRGGYASHGWRRAGGTALKNLHTKGYLDFYGFSHGVPEYLLNDVGRDAVTHYTVEPGQIRRSPTGRWYLVVRPCAKPRGWWWVAGSRFPDYMHAEKTPTSDLFEMAVETRPMDQLFGKARDPWFALRDQVGPDPI